MSTSFLDGKKDEFKVKTTSTVNGNTKPVNYTYIMNNDPSTKKVIKSSELMTMHTYKGLKPGNHDVKVEVEFANLEGKKKFLDQCEGSVTISEEPEIATSKRVERSGEDMDGKKVSSGDELIFSLTTRNISNVDFKNYEGEDDFSDVLDYADIVENGQLAEQNITLGDDNILRWKVDMIKAGEEDIKQIKVKIKNVIPTTNSPSTNSGDYDCEIHNKFGNQVSLNVDCPLVKVVERTSKDLPNTGPGTTAAIAFGTTVIAGYFLARARTLAKESDIIGRMQNSIGLGV